MAPEICSTTFAPSFRSLSPSAHSVDMPTNLDPPRLSSARRVGLSPSIESFGVYSSRDGQMKGRG
jgi:hypothetical protein